MKMKEVSKRAVALAAATIIGIGTMAGAPVSAKAADNAGIRSFVTRRVCKWRIWTHKLHWSADRRTAY